jgi:hypothetical protein
MQNKVEAVQELLLNQHFLDVIEDLKNQHINSIVYSNDQDKEIREQAYQRISCYNELMAHLESIAQTGEIKSKSWKIL